MSCHVILDNLKNQSYGNYIFRYQTKQWKKIVQIAQKQNPLKFLLLVQSFCSILNENILQSETYMVGWAHIESEVFNVCDFFPLISTCQIHSLNLIQICKSVFFLYLEDVSKWFIFSFANKEGKRNLNNKTSVVFYLCSHYFFQSPLRK